MEKHEGSTRDSRKVKKRRQRRMVIVALLLLVGWGVYLLGARDSPSLKLPRGTRITFLEVTKADNAAHGSGKFPKKYRHSRENKAGFLESMRSRVPSRLQHLIPDTHRGYRGSVTFDSPSPNVLWFYVKGRFNPTRWRFFWVDDQGYETETHAQTFSPDCQWIALDGCAPRSQKKLHLRVRSRKGEWRAIRSKRERPAMYGAVVAEMKFHNPLRPSDKVLEPRSLPATVTYRGHQVALTKAVRSRVVSSLDEDMRFDLSLADQQPLESRFRHFDWTLEDGSGNLMQLIRRPYVGTTFLCDRAPWSDDPVWKLSFSMGRTREEDFADNEKHRIERLPLPTPRGEPLLWEEKTTLQGHTLHFGEVRTSDPGVVRFRVLVSPEVEKHDLVILKAVDEEEKPPPKYGGGRTMQFIPPMSEGSRTNASTFLVTLARPERGSSVSLVFGLDKPERLEFTFRPEFEP